jgi:hypothetical protein
MDFSIASILMLDGVTNGAIYALLGLATVLVFTVTRVIFIPQGEFVAYGALTLAMLQTGKIPGTVWLLLIMAARGRPDGRRGALAPQTGHPGRALKAALKTLIFPAIVSGLSIWAAPQQFSHVDPGGLECGHRDRFRPPGLPRGLSVTRIFPAPGAADRFGRRAFRHDRPGSAVFWRRGFSQPALLGRAIQSRPRRGFRPDGDYFCQCLWR